MGSSNRFHALDLDAYRAATALELGRRVAAGELSPVQLAECALEIAERHEPTLNAYAVLQRERALDDAAQREAEVRAGTVRSSLHGVPSAIKDNMLRAGEPAGKGSLTSSDAPATASSPMVERLLDAGSVIIGRTTTPEFGWKGTGISPRTGVTRNPWNPGRNSGGSSAGAGVTVASGAVPVATGTDAGGSVRIPAAFCGVVGLKPTLGGIPVWPGTVNENLSHAGPLVRDVRDAAAVLSLTRGPDARDPQSYHANPPATSGRRLRVGIIREPFGVAPAEHVAEVVEQALALVTRSVEAEFGETQIPAPLPRDIFEGLWVTGRGLGFRKLARTHGAIMDPGLVRLGPLAERWSLADFYGVMERRRGFNVAMAGFLDEWDLVLTPTMPITPFAAEREVDEVFGEPDAPLPWITWTPYTYPFNITGQPAITVPCGLAADGLPVGLQVVGPWAADDRVLAFAATLQQLLPRLGVPVPR